MKPMYNVNANYTMGMGGYPGAAGAGIGAGYMNPAMMGMYAMGPMANVGIGQFRADYLLKGEDQLNNYYARPIAVHKKKDELPTILGILGTALGTAALLVALAKGKFKRSPRPLPPAGTTGGAGATGAAGGAGAPTGGLPTGGLPTGGANAPTGGIPTGGNSQVAGLLPHKPINPNSLPAPIYNNPTIVNTGAAAPITGSTAPITGATTPVTGTTAPVTGNGAQSTIAGYLPAHTSRVQNALNKQAAAMNLPSSGNVYTTPSAQPAGYLPAHTSRVQNALNKQAAAMNLPSSGNVYTTPVNISGVPATVGNSVVVPSPVAHNASGVTILNPGHRSNMPVASWKFGAEDVPFEEVKVATKALGGSQVKGALPAPAYVAKQQAAMNLPSSGNVYTTPLTASQQTPAMIANNNLNAVRPDLASNGSVVYTTHTPETLANGYSIGQNAKGADKLAALLAQMQA